jgi:hypothetical protein
MVVQYIFLWLQITKYSMNILYGEWFSVMSYLS